MRVLLVTYYYPPSGGPGVQRSLKFSRYLPDFGWEPVVLTVEPDQAAFPAIDTSLVGEVPRDISVHHTRAWDPYSGYARLLGRAREETIGVGFVGESSPSWRERFGRWLRANVFLPDARVGWVPFAYRRARTLVEAGDIDAIVTTGPPHSAHLIGLWLKRRTALPWVADFRDPWSGIDFADMLPATGVARRIDGALERKVLRRADAVTVVSASMARELQRIVDRQYEVILNGFDTSDFAGAVAVDPDAFIVSYVGTMNEARNPTALWNALASDGVLQSMPSLRVRLIGRVDPVVFADVRRLGLSDRVEHTPYVDHARAIEEMRRSAILLLVINRVEGAEGILTGKLFEYLGAGRPVLALGPPSGDAATLLQDARAGVVIDYDDAASVSRVLRAHHAAWRSGVPMSGALAEAAADYTRQRQADMLAQVLTAVQPAAHRDSVLS